MKNYVDQGNWNAICDICGFRFKASELRKTWDNLMVCEQDYETKHPQLMLRVRPEKTSVPWARPEPDDVFVGVCFLWDQSCYAGLATAGCALAGNQRMDASTLYNLELGTN